MQNSNSSASCLRFLFQLLGDAVEFIHTTADTDTTEYTYDEDN